MAFIYETGLPEEGYTAPNVRLPLVNVRTAALLPTIDSPHFNGPAVSDVGG